LEHSFSLPEVMSMFLELGMQLDQVIAATTHVAAAAIGKSNSLGNLRVGSTGDATVLDLVKGNFTFADRAGNTLNCRQQLLPALTVKDGVRWRKPLPPL
jgi:dihydroorotase